MAARLKNGIVAIILKDDTATPGLYTVADAAGLPSGLSATNKAYVLQALLGSRGSEPAQVILSVIDSEGDLVGGRRGAASGDGLRLYRRPDGYERDRCGGGEGMAGHGQDRLFYRKAGGGGLCRGQHGCCQFQRISIVAGGTTYTGAGYCARIAGILAATSIAASATYAPLEEVESVAAVAEPDSAVDGGQADSAARREKGRKLPAR